MGAVHFLTPEDADELVKALRTEGYDVALRESADPASRARWILQVEPFDEDVAALVDVYGGWLSDEA